MLTKPTTADFILQYPTYGEPEYTDTLADVIDEAWVMYIDQIHTLDDDKQSIAFKFAVCHGFAMACWESQGFSSAPVEMGSRNSSVRFNNRSSYLSQTMCGKKLLQLLKQKQNGIYGSEIGAPRCDKKCGC